MPTPLLPNELRDEMAVCCRGLGSTGSANLSKTQWAQAQGFIENATTAKLYEGAGVAVVASVTSPALVVTLPNGPVILAVSAEGEVTRFRMPSLATVHAAVKAAYDAI